MKLQLVVTVLLVGCTFTPSLAVPLPGEGEVRAMLQAIQKLFASENRESKQAETVARSTPPTAYSPTPLNKTGNGWICKIQISGLFGKEFS